MKQKITELHKSLCKRFFPYCDRLQVIPYSKIKFVMRFSWRLPKEDMQKVIHELIECGVFERLSQREMRLLLKPEEADIL